MIDTSGRARARAWRRSSDAWKAYAEGRGTWQEAVHVESEAAALEALAKKRSKSEGSAPAVDIRAGEPAEAAVRCSACGAPAPTTPGCANCEAWAEAINRALKSSPLPPQFFPSKVRTLAESLKKSSSQKRPVMPQNPVLVGTVIRALTSELVPYLACEYDGRGTCRTHGRPHDPKNQGCAAWIDFFTAAVIVDDDCAGEAVVVQGAPGFRCRRHGAPMAPGAPICHGVEPRLGCRRDASAGLVEGAPLGTCAEHARPFVTELLCARAMASAASIALGTAAEPAPEGGTKDGPAIRTPSVCRRGTAECACGRWPHCLALRPAASKCRREPNTLDEFVMPYGLCEEHGQPLNFAGECQAGADARRAAAIAPALHPDGAPVSAAREGPRPIGRGGAAAPLGKIAKRCSRANASTSAPDARPTARLSSATGRKRAKGGS